LLERSYGLIIMDEVNKVLDVVPSHVLLPDWLRNCEGFLIKCFEIFEIDLSCSKLIFHLK
jgi:hypothetical protein